MCYFHSYEQKKPKEFHRRFMNEVEKLQSDKNIKYLNFTGFVFPDFEAPRDFRFYKPLILKQARFRGEVTFPKDRFSDVDFTHTIFEGKVFFVHSRFYGRTIFINAVFDAPVSFSLSVFWGLADFSRANFKRNVEYVNTSFRSIASFRAAELKRASNSGRGRAFDGYPSSSC